MSHPLYFAEDRDEMGKVSLMVSPPRIVGNSFVVLIMIEMFSADVESKFVE